MRELNYNIQIIREFKIGDDDYIPFLFSLDKIKAFNKQNPIISDDCNYKYKTDILIDDFSNRLFQYAYTDYLPVEYDKEFLSKFENNIDYELIYDNSMFKIKTPKLFFSFLTNYCGYNHQMMSDLKRFLFESEQKMIKMFYDRVLEDLEYMAKDSPDKNDNIHMFQWALGHESINSNPFFPENMNKPTIEWSFREMELRNLYRSKEFNIENAIEKLKSKMMEDMKNKNKTK
jgi:hypothetical protein